MNFHLRIGLSASFTLIMSGCCSNMQTNSITQDEYQIFSAVLDSLVVKRQTRLQKYDLVLLRDSTMSYFPFPEDEIKHNFPAVGIDSLKASYLDRNGRSYEISECSFHLPMNAEVISSKRVDELIRRPESRGAIQTLYPGAPGVFGFTRAGIDSSRKFAVLTVENYCGVICGYSGTVMLQRASGKWKVVYFVIGVVW